MSDAACAKALVITFDRFALRFLGCYGNQRIETPNFDRLAAVSVLFEEHFAENTAAAAGHAWTTGCYHFPCLLRQQSQQPGVLEALRRSGVTTLLVREGAAPPRSVALHGFSQIEAVSGVNGFDAEPHETPFARLVARGREVLGELAGSTKGPWLCWLQSAGIPIPWVPPRPLLERCFRVDEKKRGAAAAQARQTTDEDETWASSKDDRRLSLNADELEHLLQSASYNASQGDVNKWPREDFIRSGLRHLYAAYVAMLDDNLGELLAAIEPHWDEDFLLIFTAAEGQSVGERFGRSHPCPRLAEEIVHTPLLIATRQPVMGSRRRDLVQTVDVAPTLMDWFHVDASRLGVEGRSLLPIVRDGQPDVREYVPMGDGQHCRGIRTRDFYLMQTMGAVENSDAGGVSLFFKPDDIWEINDVADQWPEQVRSLSQTLDEFVQRAGESRPLQLPRLADSVSLGQ